MAVLHRSPKMSRATVSEYIITQIEFIQIAVYALRNTWVATFQSQIISGPFITLYNIYSVDSRKPHKSVRVNFKATVAKSKPISLATWESF